MYRNLLFLFSLSLALFSINNLNAQQVQVLSYSVPTTGTSCTTTQMSANVQYGCNNWQFSGVNEIVSNDTLYFDIGYTAGIICTPAIGFGSHPANFVNVPPNTYVVVIRTFLNNNLEDVEIVPTPLVIVSCCNAVASFTANTTTFCTAELDTFHFTNTSTNSTSQEWYVNNVLTSTAVDFSAYFSTPGLRTIKLVVFGTGGTGPCSTEDDLVIAVDQTPNVDFGPDIQTCVGQTVTLDAGSGSPTYNWSSTPNNTSSVIATSTNTYWCEVTSFGACIASDTIDITFNPLPNVDLGSDTAICPGDELILDAGSFVAYDWSTGDTTQLIRVSSADTYSVTVTDTNGCENDDAMILSLAVAPVVDLGADTVSVCDGDTATFDAGTHSSYSWSTSENSQMISATTQGTYSVTVSNANGCTASDIVFLELFDLPIIAWPGSASLCTDTSITLDAGSFASQTWSNGSVTQTITLDSSSLNLGPNTFSVTVVDDNGCSAMASIVVSLIDCDTVNTGISLNTLDTKIEVYPNPSKDLMIVSLSNSIENLRVSIVDLAGRVHFESVYDSTNKISLDVESLSNGMYILHLQAEDKNAIVKFIKK